MLGAPYTFALTFHNKSQLFPYEAPRPNLTSTPRKPQLQTGLGRPTDGHDGQKPAQN